MKQKLELKISGREINNFRYADDTTLMAESKEEPKRLLMKMKEKSEKVGLKFNIETVINCSKKLSALLKHTVENS